VRKSLTEVVLGERRNELRKGNVLSRDFIFWEVDVQGDFMLPGAAKFFWSRMAAFIPPTIPSSSNFLRTA
jgi:hypothetical protein